MFYINYTQWVNSLKKGALLFIASLIDRRETCNSDQQGLEKGKDSCDQETKRVHDEIHVCSSKSNDKYLSSIIIYTKTLAGTNNKTWSSSTEPGMKTVRGKPQMQDPFLKVNSPSRYLLVWNTFDHQCSMSYSHSIPLAQHQ